MPNSPASDISENLVCLGQIGAPHGVQGHVRVKTFTEIPENLGVYGSLVVKDSAKRFKLASLRPLKGDMVVVKFKGVNDRDEAKALNGTRLFIEREKLPEIDDEDDYYISDLIGLRVEDTQGQLIGKIVAVHNFGAGDLLDLAPPEGRSLLVPFTKAAVPDVRLSEGVVVADPAMFDAPGEPEPAQEGEEE